MQMIGKIGILLFPLFTFSDAHVSLMWPPARAPGLDFLDSFRTKGDCGVEEPRGAPRTVLKSGGEVNVSWHLGYPHGGGYKVELTCPSTNRTFQLLPEDPASEWQTDDARYKQSHQLRLPKGVTCNDCYMRLQRQATEWGKKYKFRSCADLRVVDDDEEAEAEVCGDHGIVEGSNCVCEAGWVGEHCQYKTKCKTNDDCNGDKGHGECVIVDSAVYRQGECFCREGWQGNNCEMENNWEGSATSFDRADFQVEKLADDVELLWRKVGDEVELIMSAATTTWVGLGWRPLTATKACQKFPAHLSTPRGRDFNGMDCTDMVIGKARGALGRVADYYTRDRSTPRQDEDFGGESDLLKSHAWESEGKTNMRILRRAVGGVADHPLQGQLHLIFAHGQLSDFYQPDQLKYHGRKTRGAAFLDLDK